MVADAHCADTDRLNTTQHSNCVCVHPGPHKLFAPQNLFLQAVSMKLYRDMLTGVVNNNCTTSDALLRTAKNNPSVKTIGDFIPISARKKYSTIHVAFCEHAPLKIEI